jgi:hypothetical protein
MPLSRIQSASISDGSVATGDLANGAVTNTKLATGSVENYFGTQGFALGMRNRIINGDMRIDQRNAGASVTIPDTETVYTVDRFAVFENTSGALSAQQDSIAPTGFNNSLKITVTTADASIGAAEQAFVRQRIEGFNIADLAWGTASAQPVTLSFWVRSSLTGTFGGALNNGATNRSYPFTYSISAANTWEQKTITVAGDTTGTWLTTNGIGLQINWSLAAGSDTAGTAGTWVGAARRGVTGQVQVISTLNATWQITGVQLEAGSVATPFERRPYGTELALCQRYYETIRYETAALLGHYSPNGGVNDGPSFNVGVPFKVTKRATPSTAVVASDNNGNSYWMLAYNTQVSGTGQIDFTTRASSVDFMSAWCPRLTGGNNPIGASTYVFAGGVTFRVNSEL